MKSAIFTAKKAKFLNLKVDGIKIRPNSFKNRAKYDRKDKSWQKEW